jgi:glucose/arabinose dehydrogenase
MAVVFRQEVSIAARGSRNRDAGPAIQCLDVERMMNLTEVVVTERVTNEVRQDFHDFQD